MREMPARDALAFKRRLRVGRHIPSPKLRSPVLKAIVFAWPCPLSTCLVAAGEVLRCPAGRRPAPALPPTRADLSRAERRGVPTDHWSWPTVRQRVLREGVELEVCQAGTGPVLLGRLLREPLHLHVLGSAASPSSQANLS